MSKRNLARARRAIAGDLKESPTPARRMREARKAIESGTSSGNQTAHDLERAARKIASLVRRQKELKDQLTAVAGELRVERRFLRALTNAVAVKVSPDSAPMRAFGEGGGGITK